MLMAGAMVLSGCKTHVNELEPVTLGEEKVAEPSMILVVPYTVSREDVKLDAGPLQRILRRTEIVDAQEQEAELIEKLSRNLAQGMVDQFQNAGYNAKLVERDSDASNGELVVDGMFTSVDAGNTAKRMMVGFGAGAAKVRAVTRVIYIKGNKHLQVMMFSSEGESTKKPGAAVGMGSGAAVAGASAAAGGVSEGMNNAEGVAHKSGRDLADKILTDFPKLGWRANKTEAK
jgi:hypothetical protein